jgi:NAD/NADP transhydrogenase beta subunit
MFPAEQRGFEDDERGVSLRPALVALLTAIAGISSAAVGFVLDNAVMMVVGMVLGGMVVNLIANAMSRHPGSRARER